MICKNCGKEIPDEAHFCPKCGYDLSNTSKSSDSNLLKMRVCSHCGSLIRSNAEFCDQCGKPVNDKKLGSGKYNTFNPFSGSNYMTETMKWIATGIVAIIAVLILVVGVAYTHQIRTADDEVVNETDGDNSETKTEEDSAVTAPTIGDTVSSDQASFTLLDFQWIQAVSLDEYNNFEPVSEDYSGKCYKAEDGYVLAYIKGTYQYTGTKKMSTAYRAYDDSGNVWSTRSLCDLIDIKWNNKYTFSGKDYCVGSSKVGENMTSMTAKGTTTVNSYNFSRGTDGLLEQEPLSEPVTFRCYFSVPSQVAEGEDEPLKLTIYLPVNCEPQNAGSDLDWTPQTTPYTFVINS